MKDYLIKETDPTLSQMRWAVIIMWAVTASIIISMFVPHKPLLKPPVTPVKKVYELNGYMWHSNYVGGEIR